MKVLKRKMLNVLLAFVMVFSFVFSGWGGVFTAISVKAGGTELANENTKVTFSSIDSSWNNTPLLDTYCTIFRFDGGIAGGGSDRDFSDLMAKMTINDEPIDPANVYFEQGSWIGASGCIIMRVVQNPAEGSILKMPAGATFTVGGTDTNVYEIASDTYFQLNGTWAIYTPPLPVTFTKIDSTWNNSSLLNTYCTIFRFDGGISGGGADRDFSNLMAKMTINDEPIDPANVYFEQGSWIGATGCIIMRVVQNPAEGSILKMPAGATFTVGGTDTNVYEIASDTYFQLNATGWAIYTPPAEPVEVTFTKIDSTWNNSSLLNTYCTIFHFDGGISGGGSDRDFSDLMAKMTINDEPIDSANVYFEQGSWIGFTDCIIMRVVQNPAEGSILKMPAGATFTVGGDDTNIYQLTDDIRFTFNGTAWVAPASATYYVVETTENDGVIHTLSTFQNLDGSFTYTLPEYTAEGKVLLGYAVTEGGVEKMLPAGEYTTTDGSGLLFTALWAKFTTIDGASIRIASAETSGIRWTTTIDEAGFSNVAYWAKGGYSFGTELSADGFAENFDIVANTWKVENSTYTGVLTDINSKYYTQEFTARGYVDITYSSGETKRIYAIADDTTRSIKQVAEFAIASGDYSGTQLSILQQIAGV